jgi:YegS/Rv2252/BmrU family lipid kinase
VTHALVIGRKRKGRPIREAVRDARRRLEAAGWTVEDAVVGKKKALRRRSKRAVDDGLDVVVAVGGDGVVLQVVQSLGGTDVTLGIVPMGTGNLLAANLGIDRRPDVAVRVLVDEHRRRIDLGEATVAGRTWLYSVACGVGFDAEVMKATKRSNKRRWGRLAYVASAIGASNNVRDVPHSITVDGKTTDTPAMQVFVANFGRTGLSVKPRLPVEPDDGVLDVIVLRASGRLRALAAAWQAVRQSHEGPSHDRRVLRARAEEVRVDADPKRLVEIDGSVIGTTPVAVSVRPGALTVLAPRLSVQDSGSRDGPESGQAAEVGDEAASREAPASDEAAGSDDNGLSDNVRSSKPGEVGELTQELTEPNESS